MVNTKFWRGKRVFITGHTGFKGSWLSLWLSSIGAEIFGYALKPPTTPSLFELCRLDELVTSSIADIRDLDTLRKNIQSAEPDIVFHMAAQPLVRYSYLNPIETYMVNIMGTANLLEAVRDCPSVRAVVVITTDKCYENREWFWGYRENDSLGGYDPYSSSKAGAELVVAGYRNSFFNPDKYQEHQTAIASVRAGNVIGGGDWAFERLIPDCIKAILSKEDILIRSPYAIRPWQHVLEPLDGYLELAEKLFTEGIKYSGAWNFGPDSRDMMTVQWIVEYMCQQWGLESGYKIQTGGHPHETNCLMLDCSKAHSQLNWWPKWDIKTALDSIVTWAKHYEQGHDMRKITLEQIEAYSNND